MNKYAIPHTPPHPPPMSSSPAVWLDISDAGQEDGTGAAPLASPWVSATAQLDRTELRNRASEEAVAEALQRLREAASRAAGIVTGIRSPGAAEPSMEGSAVVGGTDPLPPQQPGPPVAALSSRALAFVPRMQTAARLLDASSLSGSPAAAAARVAAAAAAAARALQDCEDRFPAAVRAASGRTVNEARQLFESGLAEMTRATAEAEGAVGKFEAQQAARAAAARTEAEQTMNALRAKFLRSEAVVQLRIDVAEAARLAGGPGGSALAAEFESLPAHLDALQRAPDAEAVEREAECVLLAFRNFTELGGPGSSAPPASARAVPSQLLDQIASAERRREMAGMSRERAASLLEHTRRALSRAASEQEARRLRVVASILEIRARPEGETQRSEADAAMRHLHRRWELRAPELRRALERLAASARLTAAIIATNRTARTQTTARMRQALARSVADTARRVAAGSSSKATRWLEEVAGAFRTWQGSILDAARALSEAALSALDLFVGTGLLVGAETEGYQEDEDEDEQVVPLSVWQREREMAADRFVATAQPAAAIPAGSGSGSGSGPAAASATASASASASASPRQLLRKVHALTLSGFVAWIEYAEAVLLANANGTLRAASAMQAALATPRKRFEEMVAAQIQRAQRE
jgi:hypothetical protein